MTSVEERKWLIGKDINKLDGYYKAIKVNQMEINKLIENNKNLYKEYFLSKAQELFNNCPELKSFGWTQYTPYFNDGETCYFSAHTDTPKVNGISEYDDECTEEINDMMIKVTSFLNKFTTEQFEEFFGDHSEITCFRDKIEVDGYEHD